MSVIISKNFFNLLSVLAELGGKCKIAAFVSLAFWGVGTAFGQVLPLAEADQAKIEAELGRLSLEQKIGQMFVFGFRGQEMDPPLRRLLAKYKPGSLIVFHRNIRSPEQISTLNQQIQEVSRSHVGLPMLLMVDQEGGTVTRVKTNPSPPSALALGMADDPKLVREAGKITGKIISLLGFNMNLAPVMDLSDPYEGTFIGNRSFGQSPERVKLFGEAYSAGLADAGVIPTSKHFPGHGGVITDSHRSLPHKKDTLEQLETRDLVPFEWFAKFQYPSAIMVAHIAFPSIDPSGVPATFSKMLITEVLRKRTNYPGLVITDDIEMSAAGSIGAVGERAVRAILAGCDQVMVAWTPSNQRLAVTAVREAIASGRISVERVDESVRRILRVKLALRPPVGNSPSELSSRFAQLAGELRVLTNRVSQENLTKSLRGYSYLEGSAREVREALVFSADPRFYHAVREVWGSGAKLRVLSPGTDPEVTEALASRPNSLALFYATGSGTVRMVNTLDEATKARLIVVNTTNPGAIYNTNQFLAVVNLNSRNFQSGYWLTEFLRRLPPEPEDLRGPAAEEGSTEARAQWPPSRRRRLKN